MNRAFYNNEGYADPTPYLALRNLQREERADRHRKKARKNRCPHAGTNTGSKECREDEKYFWEELANAIIIQAAEDWRRAMRILQYAPNNDEAKATVEETERFFLSDWYKMLTAYDGLTLLNRLKEEFKP